MQPELLEGLRLLLSTDDELRAENDIVESIIQTPMFMTNDDFEDSVFKKVGSLRPSVMMRRRLMQGHGVLSLGSLCGWVMIGADGVWHGGGGVRGAGPGVQGGEGAAAALGRRVGAARGRGGQAQVSRKGRPTEDGRPRA